MNHYCINAENGIGQAITEKEFCELCNSELFFENITGDTRTLYPYNVENTNYRFFPEKGVEKSFDKPVFLALIRNEGDYRQLCKKQGLHCPKRFVLYNEGGLRALTFVNSDVRITSTTEEERAKKKNSRLRNDGINFEEVSLELHQEETDYEPESGVDIEAEAIANLLPDELWSAVDNALSEKDVFIMRAYYRDELTESEIAEILDMSQQAVSNRRKKSLTLLKINLQDFKVYLE